MLKYLQEVEFCTDSLEIAVEGHFYYLSSVHDSVYHQQAEV